MRIESYGRTDVGLKRGHNEDCFHILETEGLFMVADGMGGHRSGEVAARMAVDTIAGFFNATKRDEEVTWPFKLDKTRDYVENRLLAAVRLANLRIFESAERESQLHGMGTTIVSLLLLDDRALIAHVGDSRIYRHHANEFVQLTEDHSLLNDYIRMKKLTAQEIEQFPHKNVIVRALGMKETVQVDLSTVKAEKDDLFLLCSDGLSGMVPDPKMEEIVKRQPDLGVATQELIDAANAAGGNDNISVVLIRIGA
ncbi:MAG: Stp1/IreP family PP2C-type Ser/Thr phosphatase [Deltaproteobacteria bacterium]|nr:Stp1/IreP family PP2C-type Ser/Thr phosphatase [Deltaproteobacteria bacterium]